MAIASFKDEKTEIFYNTEKVHPKMGWQNLAKIVLRKLDMIEYAETLDDLKSPPNNNLEALKGDTEGCHSIRVNDKWRIVFRWTSSGAEDVAVIDYH